MQNKYIYCIYIDDIFDKSFFVPAKCPSWPILDSPHKQQILTRDHQQLLDKILEVSASYFFNKKKITLAKCMYSTIFKNNNVWHPSLSLDLCSVYQDACPPVLDSTKMNAHPFGKLPVKVENHSPVICYSGIQGSAKTACSGKVTTTQTISM